MKYSEGELQSTEEEVRRYFRRITEINRLKHRLEFLEKRRAQVEHDIDSSNIRLSVTVSSIAYDSEPVQSSGPKSSQQERSLESAFGKLEGQLSGIKTEILDTKIVIADLELRNCDMEFIIAQLKEAAQEFIHLHYEKDFVYIKISNILHMSPASISRLRIKTLSEIRDYSNTQADTETAFEI